MKLESILLIQNQGVKIYICWTIFNKLDAKALIQELIETIVVWWTIEVFFSWMNELSTSIQGSMQVIINSNSTELSCNLNYYR